MTNISSRLFLGVLAIKVAAVIAVAILAGPKGFLWSGDAQEYIDLGRNLVSGNGFARTGDGEFIAAQDRTPFYPLVVGSAMTLTNFQSAWPVAFIQAVLAAFIAVLTYNIALYFLSERWALVPALIVSFEPLISSLHLLIFTETFLVFFVLLFMYFFLRFFEHNRQQDIVIASAALAFAMLTKPVAVYLAIIPFCFLLWHGVRINLKGLGIFIIVMIIFVSPWIARNVILFDSFAITTYGQKATCGYQISAVFATAHRFSHTTPGIAMAEVRTHPRYQALEKSCFQSSVFSTLFGLFRAFPYAFVKANMLATAGFFTNEGYTAFFDRPSTTLPPHHNYLTPAVFSGPAWNDNLSRALRELSLFEGLVVLGGKLFWLLAVFFAGIGAMIAFRASPLRSPAFFLTLVILYFAAATVLAAGFGAGARYRYPVDAPLLIFATLGFVSWFSAAKYYFPVGSARGFRWLHKRGTQQ